MLADLVETVAETTAVGVASLVTSHRFGASIGALASAVREGDADRAVELLEAGGEHVELVHVADPAGRVRELVLPHALGVLRAAEAGDADRALELLDRAAAAVRAPRGAVRRAPLEHPGRALARRGDG